jgi:uncharacterized protein (TIGR02599 family)
LKSKINGMGDSKGFSLLELLASMTIFAFILALLAAMTSHSLSNWRRLSDKHSGYLEVQAAFESISNRLAHAELNPYWGYEYGSGISRSPTKYKKQSSLHFVCGGAGVGTGNTPALLDGPGKYPGHAVFFTGSFGVSNSTTTDGLGTLLNGWGYFVEFGSDLDEFPGIFHSEGNVQPKYRFRLLEWQQPTEKLALFRNKGAGRRVDLEEAATTDDLFSWFRNSVDAGIATPLAENIVAFVITPLRSSSSGDATPNDSIAPKYYYDTRAAQHSSNLDGPLIAQSAHQLPPLVRVTLVAIGEGSATRLADNYGSNLPDLGISHLFQKAEDYESDIS